MRKPILKIWDTFFLSTTASGGAKMDLRLNLENPTAHQTVEWKNHYKWSGEKFSPDEMPRCLHFHYYDIPESKKAKTRDMLTSQFGVVIVSERMHELLTQFDLGQTMFHPLPLYEYDQKTRRDGLFYLMHILDFRDVLVPEPSENIERVAEGKDIWRHAIINKDKLAVRLESAEGVDMWMDKRMRERIFFSDRLKTAIKAAGFKARGLTFRRCKIVQP